MKHFLIYNIIDVIIYWYWWEWWKRGRGNFDNIGRTYQWLL